MSDSASRSEVEDVLSSVRRLVSSEAPRKRRPDVPAGQGALVLTDAQRVERKVSRGHAAKSLEDRIAELEAAVSSKDDEYEPDGSEDQAQHTPDRIVYTRPPSEAEEAKARGAARRLSRLSVVASDRAGDDATDEAEADDAEAAPVAFRRARDDGDESDPRDSIEEEAPMAEDVDAPPREKAEVRPFHNPDDMIGRFEARMDGGEPPRPGLGHNGFSERLEPYRPDGDEAEASQAGAPKTNRIADDDADDADADDEFEAALTDAVTQSVVTAMPAAAPPAEAGEAVTPEETGGDAETETAETAPAAEEQTGGIAEIDEDALRPIVAKLIREELQGELGERITRNVRKLVRREILRAINAREFE